MRTISNYLFKDNPKRILLAFTFVFILISLGIGIYIITSISKINSAYKLTAEVEKELSLFNKADQIKKEFLQTNVDENYALNTDLAKNQFDSTLSIAENILNTQMSNSIIGKNQEEKVEQLLNEIAIYKAMFHRVIELNNEKYNASTGLNNQMNVALQSLERSELPVNMVPLVTLKRNQKDFELKKDLSFYQSFKEESEIFTTEISSYEISPTETNFQKEELLKNLNSYVNTFGKIVEIEKVIGLNDEDGLKGKLNLTFKSIDSDLNQLNKIYEARSLSIARYIKLSIVVLFLIIIIAIFSILNYFIKHVYNPILDIQLSAEQIALGNLNINLNNLKRNKLLKRIVDSFGNMINKLEITLSQIEDIAKLNLNNKIELSSENDMIGKSVINVQKQLFKFTDDERLTKIEDEKRNWSTEGLALFSNFLRGNGDMKNISQTIISNLVKYLKANQGGLYIVNSNEQGAVDIELLACFAFERKKFINQRIEIGEGLIGQCYLEKESIYMSDVPDDYVKITSGLGNANPRSILIVPAKINDSIEAIIEIASFHQLEKYQIDFVEKLAENIASAIWNIQVNDKTKRLLEESQLQTEEMKSKEEEMHQSIEELASIHEEMNRKEKYYQSKIEEITISYEELKRKEKTYQSKIEELLAIQEELKRKEQFYPLAINELEMYNKIDPVSDYQHL
jgi:hypothetical protein